MLFGGVGDRGDGREVGFGQLHMQHSGRVPVGELSMRRPDELTQDFDFYYTQQAKRLAKEHPELFEYRGSADAARL